MKKYFLHNGTEQQGPFDIEDLKREGIKRDTSIWYEGLPDWKKAGEIEELSSVFSSTPPPFNSQQSTPPPFGAQQTTYNAPIQPQPERKSKVGRNLLIALGVIAFFYIVAVVINNLNHSDGTYQQKIMTVEEIERSQPTKFLNASGTYRENFWGDKFKIKCTIVNKATVAKFKDAVVRVTYYSKTKTALGSKDYTIYEAFPPNSEKTVDLKIENYKDVSTLGWDVVKAVNYY